MVEKGITDAEREAYLNHINSKALNGDSSALEELSGIAAGGNVLARRLIENIESRNIKFKGPKISDENRKRSPDLAYAVLHPINFLRVKSRQIGVSIDEAQPPVGSTFEEFPSLSVQKAAELMGLEKDLEIQSGGVQLKDWPSDVQNEMREGKVIHPDGRTPDQHPNI